MPLKIESMPQLTKRKPLRKGASEEHIYAENQKAKTTAALVAALVPRDINTIAGRS